MAFRFEPLEIEDVVHIATDYHGDTRGGFAEMYKETDFQAAGIEARFVQVNYSKSEKNVLRGLHYQKLPTAQGKLVSVISGEVFDVAADIREDSPTHGKWVGERLSAETKNMLWIPPGLAHGFCVLSETAEVMYFVTESEYAPEAEAGIIWNDPTLAIDWPVKEPILSEKDKGYPGFGEA